MYDLWYYRGGRDCYESVELCTEGDGGRTRSCMIKVRMLLDGINDFTCSDGEDIALTPGQRLEILEYVQEKREMYAGMEPVRTLGGWRGSGLYWEEYCRPGELVTGDIVDEFAGSVPPETIRNGYLQAGEAYSCEPDGDGIWRYTYTTFTYYGEDGAGGPLWLHNGYCFKDGTDNRAEVKTRLERQIEALRDGI